MTSFHVCTFLWSNPQAKHKGVFEFTEDHASKLYRRFAKGFSDLNEERVEQGKEPFDFQFTCVTDQRDVTRFDRGIRLVPLWNDFRDLGRCFTKLKMFSTRHQHPVYGTELTRSELFPGDFIITIDLDIVITNPKEFVRALTSKRMQPWLGYRDTKNPRCYSGALWRIDTNYFGGFHNVYDTFRHVYDTLKHNLEAFKFFYANWNAMGSFVGSDQCWITTAIGEHSFPNKWNDREHGVFDAWSVKHLPSLPLNTCAVFLNGMSRDVSLPEFKDLLWVKEHYYDV